MAKLLPQKTSHRIIVITVAAILFLGGGAAGARWIAWPYFKAWREARANSVARDYYEKGDYANALTFFEEALRLDPKFPKARYNRGNARLILGDSQGALEDCDAALAGALAEDASDGARIRAWCLGLGADPLTFAMDLLTVVVIDAPLYDELFGAVVSGNAEGTVLPLRPFTAASVTDLVANHPVQAAGAALLTLALRHRAAILT